MLTERRADARLLGSNRLRIDLRMISLRNRMQNDAFEHSSKAFAQLAGQFANIAVDRLTGIDLLGDVVGGVVQRALR